jgi:copper chaperone CopZ
VGRLDGVSSVKVRFASSRVVVDHDPARVSVADLIAAVSKAGYAASKVAL